MDSKTNTDATSATPVSAACTAPKISDLMENKPKLSEVPAGMPFVNLTKTTQHPPFIFKINGRLPFRPRPRKNVSVPVPAPAQATLNWKKRKLIVDSQRIQPQGVALPSLESTSEDISAAVQYSQSQAVTLPDLESFSGNISTAVIDNSDETATVSPINIDPGCTLPFLSATASISKTKS